MRLVLAAALLAIATPALANDTMANLSAGGLISVRNDTVSMESEDLFISKDEVRVDYVFRNLSEADVESVVAFPMPDIEASPNTNVSLPQTSDNFLGFSVTVDGESVEPTLDQRVFAAEIDVTDEIREAGVPLFPYAEDASAAIAGLSDAQRQDWIARGLIVTETYDDGAGMKDHFSPTWTLKSTYWWRMNFPKGKPVKVQHSYQPSVGGTVGVTFVVDGAVGGTQRDEYRHKYCMDSGFERAVQKAVDASGEGYAPYFEEWISYVLVTGGNWAGTIGKFKLTIDKGKADSLISFCGAGVRKTGPTTFELTAEDFYPERNVDILILNKQQPEQ